MRKKPANIGQDRDTMAGNHGTPSSQSPVAAPDLPDPVEEQVLGVRGQVSAPDTRHPAPDTRLIELGLLLEPDLPARETMDEDALGELMQSMTANGQLVPLIVVHRGERYEITDGHRRLIAAQRLGWPTLRCEVYESDGLAVEAAKCAAMLDREGWNPAQEAVYYKQLVEKYQLDEAGLCALVRRSPDYVGSRWKLLFGDPDIFELVRAAALSLGVAQQLNRVPDEMYRKSFLDSALRGGSGARVVKQWVDEWLGRQITPPGGETAMSPAGAGPATSGAALVPPPTVRACALCGGFRDPQNLVEITLHTWEWESILKTLHQAQSRRQTEAAHGD